MRRPQNEHRLAFPRALLCVVVAAIPICCVSPTSVRGDEPLGKPTETKPTETKPTETKPNETKPTETKTAGEPSADAEALGGSRALSRAFRYAARKATPSVVTILTYGQPVAVPRRAAPNGPGQANQDQPDAAPQMADENTLTGLGSGVIISPGGRVITNNHVIAGAKRVVVQLSDETELLASNVFGDPASDVATLKLTRSEPFDHAELADSDMVEIGDWVLAIGSPFRFEATVSAGIISAKNRALPLIDRGRVIQTDAAISPGNSGGPLIDLDGKVVAINTAIATRNGGYHGIGFAIPINQAKWIADELAKHQKVRRAAIGLRIAELNPRIAAKFELPVGLGILAHQIIEDSAADRAGMKPLDVIMEIGGQRVTDPASLQSAVERQPVGSFQEFKIFRDGKQIVLKVEIASLEDPTLSSEDSKDEPSEDSKEDAQPDSADPPQ